jgi:hypothetical protein
MIYVKRLRKASKKQGLKKERGNKNVSNQKCRKWKVHKVW